MTASIFDRCKAIPCFPFLSHRLLNIDEIRPSDPFHPLPKWKRISFFLTPESRGLSCETSPDPELCPKSWERSPTKEPHQPRKLTQQQIERSPSQNVRPE